MPVEKVIEKIVIKVRSPVSRVAGHLETLRAFKFPEAIPDLAGAGRSVTGSAQSCVGS